MDRKIKSRAALDAWQQDEAAAEQARKDARVVSACTVSIKDMEREKPITEKELLEALGQLGRVKSIKILFTNMETD